MAYTVKQVAEMSGVSVRALHFYDEVGLLKPAYHAANGYRLYEEPQLLTLQQILFYRELGFELKQIRSMLSQPDFDKIAALESHRKVLRKNLAHTRKLIETIDKTIQHLKGTKRMKSQELFEGFDPKEQAKHEQYLIDRYGECMKESIAQSKARVKHWTKRDWAKSGAAFDGICKDLVKAMGQALPPDSTEVQAVVRRHCEWLKQFWTPKHESYAGHGQFIVDSDLRKAYETHDPRLPEFAAAAIKIFAERELA
ncbi:MAG: MerR family transcriptional regulator [Verrucomicrobia bacterium]|nr:MerR family transcriptional regulator [Verrucomicrobiota bacterium]